MPGDWKTLAETGGGTARAKKSALVAAARAAALAAGGHPGAAVTIVWEDGSETLVPGDWKTLEQAGAASGGSRLAAANGRRDEASAARDMR